MGVIITITVEIKQDLEQDFINIIKKDEILALGVNHVFNVYNYHKAPFFFTIKISCSNILNFNSNKYKILDFFKSHEIKHSKHYNFE